MVIFNFSSGSSTLPLKKILPSRTFTESLTRYFFSVKANLACKFFCIIESSIWVPNVLGSNATLTPEPKTPTEEDPIHAVNEKKRNNTIIVFFIFNF